MPRDAAFTVPVFPRVHEYAGPWMIEPYRGGVLLDMARRTDWFKHVAETDPPKPMAAVEMVPTTGDRKEREQWRI